MCSNTSSKTWTPLPERFIDEHLVGGNVPTLRSGATSADRRHKSGCDTHAPAASLKSLSPAPYPFTRLNTLIKTRCSAKTAMFVVYITPNCSRGLCQHNVTSGRFDCSNLRRKRLCWKQIYFIIDMRRWITVYLLRYETIFSSEIWFSFRTSAPSFVRMRSDLPFLPYIVYGVHFFRIRCSVAMCSVYFKGIMMYCLDHLTV